MTSRSACEKCLESRPNYPSFRGTYGEGAPNTFTVTCGSEGEGDPLPYNLSLPYNPKEDPALQLDHCGECGIPICADHDGEFCSEACADQYDLDWDDEYLDEDEEEYDEDEEDEEDENES